MSKRSMKTEPNQHSIVATSFFNAPRQLVFKVLTDPQTIPEWWGPRGLITKVDKMEPWAGGSWRYVVSNSKGDEWPFHGVYHTVEAPGQIVFTYEYEDLPGKVSLETTILEDHEDGTKMTTISVYQTVEDRDNMLKSDMEEGADETNDRLEELLMRMHASV